MAGAENLQRELSAQDPRGAARADREPLPAGDQHLGRTLRPFTEEGQVYAYGFGDKVTQDKERVLNTLSTSL